MLLYPMHWGWSRFRQQYMFFPIFLKKISIKILKIIIIIVLDTVCSENEFRQMYKYV